jgi:ABC-type dipeptide/oligopeptide/nickel transport system ATPase component
MRNGSCVKKKSKQGCKKITQYELRSTEGCLMTETFNRPLVDVHGLEVHFGPLGNPVRAADKVDFQVFSGEVVALVGESGSGKSVSALALSKLIPEPAGRIVGGSVSFRGIETLTLKPSRLRKLRGEKIAYIFQEPATSLNPVFTVGWQIGEAIRLHRKGIRAKDEINNLLAAVGLPDPERTAKAYPHELSGGMQQRAMIAMALACNPQLLVADEPTTALDVTVQKQILDLLVNLRNDRGLSILLITHNLGIVADIADRIYVMTNGKIVESGETKTVLRTPRHDYTKKLLRAVPRLHKQTED